MTATTQYKEAAKKGLRKFSEFDPSMFETRAHIALMAVCSVFNIKLAKIGGTREYKRRAQFGAVLARFYRFIPYGKINDYFADNAYNKAMEMALTLSDVDISECMQIAYLKLYETGDFQESRKAVRNYIEALTRHTPVGEKETRKAICADMAKRIRANGKSPVFAELISEIELTELQKRIIDLLTSDISQSEAHKIVKSEGYNISLSTFQIELERVSRAVLASLETVEECDRRGYDLDGLRAELDRKQELRRANKRRAYEKRKEREKQAI